MYCQPSRKTYLFGLGLSIPTVYVPERPCKHLISSNDSKKKVKRFSDKRKIMKFLYFRTRRMLVFTLSGKKFFRYLGSSAADGLIT